MTYKHYLRGDLVGEYPWPDECTVTQQDFGRADDAPGPTDPWVVNGPGRFEPHLVQYDRELRVIQEATEGWLARVVARRRGSARWDWLRYLGLLGRRVGAGGLLLPSGTWWEKLRGMPARREYAACCDVPTYVRFR